MEQEKELQLMKCPGCGRLMARILWEAARFDYPCFGIPGAGCTRTLKQYKPETTAKPRG